MADNARMRIPGHVANGVVVLDNGATLPEGASVIVSCEAARRSKSIRKKGPVVLPLVKSNRPGSLNLSNQRIAQILVEEDVANYSRFFKKRKA